MKRRVVITGMGIWSCLGQDLETVSENLRKGHSGIVSDASRLQAGFRCSLVGNIPEPQLRPFLTKAQRLTMSKDVQYTYMATRQAFEDARIDEQYLKDQEVGVIVGNDGSMDGAVEAIRAMDAYGDPIMVGPGCYFRWATSSPTMNLSSLFHLKGVSFTTGAACASGIHAIGVASLYIRSGLQDTMLVGGCADPSFHSTIPGEALFIFSNSNQNPQAASRPFDDKRDGMVPSGGAAMLVLEEYNHAVERGARIYAEVLGYGASTNGLDNISAPDADGEYRAMRHSIEDAGIALDEIDYINAHATSTVAGDIAEVNAIRRLIEGRRIPISATKSMTGHENWMTGASETIYSLLMMRDGFVAPTINLEQIMPEADGLFLPTTALEKKLEIVMKNSFGLGGTNGCIVLKKIN